jgi:hypothetical protein
MSIVVSASVVDSGLNKAKQIQTSHKTPVLTQHLRQINISHQIVESVLSFIVDPMCLALIINNTMSLDTDVCLKIADQGRNSYSTVLVPTVLFGRGCKEPAKAKAKELDVDQMYATIDRSL